MSKSHNSIQLIGYLGQLPVAKTAVNGSKLVKLRLATNDYFRKLPDGPAEQKVSWHNIMVWDQLTNAVTENFIVGTHLLVEGQLRYRSFLDSEGKKRSTAEIRATKIVDLDR